MRRFEEKVALVTGAASGIGRESAERLASVGARVFCVDAQAGAVEQTAKRVAYVPVSLCGEVAERLKAAVLKTARG